MNTSPESEAVAAAIEILRSEADECDGAVAVSIGQLIKDLGDTAPTTADDLLALGHGLLDDERIQLVNDDTTIGFGFDGR
jgi:hypothetical protein